MSGRRLHVQASRLRAQLDTRALAVLDTLYRFRLLTTAQVQRLYLVSGVPGSRIRRTQYLMKRLQTLALVVRLSRVIGGVRAGSSGFVYGLSALGQAVLDVSGPAGGRRRRVWETTPYFQDHMLMVAELYVGLREAERQGQAMLLTFTSEPGCWRHFTGSGGELVVLKPDAYVRVGFQAVERRVFIEVDLATESLPTIVRKSARYVAYWRSGVEQQRAGVFPQVVWLVPDQHRLQNIQRALGSLAVEASGLFEVALIDAGPRLLMAPPELEEKPDHSSSRPPP
ncbi:replication-relaxation family protein [Saccharothrix texasensis]|uniref:Protein involved in plasmid replication-relaxation n=1 Tax=Saccharothrix texasensis TaxID=103734 RepID=A0A3N1H8W5_9PSEU|nr:replication-relaxation family protein [Saccharothrix texasensis]ROP38965.1 protein involved in plasmid replication-relaxation [Saccharothrix texasensis]